MRLLRTFYHSTTIIQTFLLYTTTITTLLLPTLTTARPSSPHHLKPSNHTNNYALILQSSVFFHNYRHTSNALGIYHSLKQHGGFTDDHILLFLGDEVACNARNPLKDTILPYRSGGPRTKNLDLYDGHVEVDYGGEDVTVDNFLRVLSGRHHPLTPASMRLPYEMDEGSNLFIYITGHGGDEFFKFRDKEELTMKAFRNALDEMQFRKRFGKVLFVTDTCQAFTLAPNTEENDKPPVLPFDTGSPAPLKNVYTIGSSIKDHNSYSHHSDNIVGHSVLDRYVHNLMQYMGWMDTNTKTGKATSSSDKWSRMEEMSVKEALVDSFYDRDGYLKMGTEIGWTDHGCDVRMKNVPLSDFMVMRRGGKTRASEVGVEVLVEGVDFMQQTTTSMTAAAAVPEVVVVERERPAMNGRQTPPVGREGTTPTDPMFVVSIFVSMLGIWYSSPYLW